jgi:hypothetical protein
MTLRDLQRQAVDSIKRHALAMSVRSPRAQRQILTEYLWSEEGAESTALGRVNGDAPSWLGKLVSRQLEDEQRHAQLLRDRLAELGTADATRPPPALARAKLWWLERACAQYMTAFEAGPIVVVLAAAAQLEATGVRVFSRHLGVLEQLAPDDRTTSVVRSILSDEKRHAKSCAAALDRLVLDSERDQLAALRERVAMIDRAFGVTLALAYWMLIAQFALRDRLAPAAPQQALRSAA